MRPRSAHLSAVMTLVIVSTLCIGLPAVAQENAATPDTLLFGIFPVGDFENRYFEVEIEAGESLQLTAGMSNGGTDPVRLRTFATNAFNPPNGGFAAGEEADEPVGTTLWIDYPAESFELAPGESRTAEFTVSVPEGTAPGQYVAALVVQTEEPIPVPGSEIFQQIIRSAVSVEITVPGPITPGFELGTPEFSIDTAVRSLVIPVTNTGNILVKPAGTLEVATPDGQVVLSSAVEMGSVYGGTSTTIQVSLPEQFQSGDYLVSVDLNDDATGAAASLVGAQVTLAEPVVEEPQTFVIDAATVTPNGNPIQYADVAATITNNGQTIPTANVTLNVQRDGETVESYPLAENQALPQGTTEFSQRYIPVDGWQSGTYTFELIISAVSGGTETVLATVEIPDEITAP